MPKSIKEFSKIGRNKYTRQLLAKQKELKRGRESNVTAPRMSAAVGRKMPYMHERNDTKIQKRRLLP